MTYLIILIRLNILIKLVKMMTFFQKRRKNTTILIVDVGYQMGKFWTKMKKGINIDFERN